MKKTGILLAGLLIVCLVCIAGPALAQQTVSQTFQILGPVGGPTPSFSMTFSPPYSVNIPEALGNNIVNGPQVSIASNTPYTIQAFDPLNTAPVGTYGTNQKPAGSAGHLAGMTPTASWDGTWLTNPLGIQVDGGSTVLLSGSPQTIRTGSTEDYTGPLVFSQQVMITDPPLGQDNDYVQITVTGGASD